MSTRDMPLIDHAAGSDTDLYPVFEELKLNRYRLVKEVLAETGHDWQLRTFRSQVIALYAAHTLAIDYWYQEEPHTADSLLMRARVLTQRIFALQLPMSDPAVLKAAEQARRACHAAIQANPRCPAARVCLLALAQFDADPRYKQKQHDHWAPGPDTLPEGPWPLYWAVRQRDPENREAYQRLLQFFYARRDGAHNVAQWLATSAGECSNLHMVPLYAHAEDYRQRRDRGASDFTYWTGYHVQRYVQWARDRWFAYLDEQTRASPVLSMDFNLLAWSIDKSGVGGAGPVFEAIGPYATAMPWQTIDNRSNWVQDFLKARHSALAEQHVRY
ncbi:hypothetical protein [Streptomyces tauricus]|uniref:hypothetical protein n=1 Tax=Streptomyces tauricus TaxID=68274 RepID=UPI0022447916|nr:hypothetical protein [Streptomyces tauricus]MCW8101692.1 hypothetical protein [Streptomyces tauricus]